jgi:hypothetical protein
LSRRALNFRISSEGRASARPKRSFLQSALKAAEKLLSFVGRAFRQDIKSAFSSGVLTPEDPNAHFSATCLASEVEFGCGSAARCLGGQLEPCLNAGGESAEVADSSDFVIGELDAKVVFKATQKFKGLQAVDSQFLKEIIVGLKLGARNFELRRGEIQNLIGCLFEVFHFYPHFTRCEGLAYFVAS